MAGNGPQDYEAPRELEDLLEEYLQRLRSGEKPDVEEYAEAQPKLADEIRELFATVKAMEGLKRRSENVGAAAGGAPAPERLGDFRLLSVLGQGGMGVVYEAEQLSLGRVVALKVLPSSRVQDHRALVRFRNEARIAAGLEHPAIVNIHFVGEDQGRHFFAMQRIEGASLGECLDWLRRHGARHWAGEAGCVSGSILAEAARQVRSRRAQEPLPDNAPDVPDAELRDLLAGLGREYCLEVAAMARDAALALQYAHGKGVLHRDIKPGNLLLDREGRVFVADFGLARAMESQGLTRTGDITGTLRCMAPEQFGEDEQAATDPRTDIYSLGVVLHESLSLQPPFGRASVSQLVRRILDGDRPTLSDLHPHLPPGLEELVDRAMALDPDERFQSAGELARALGRIVSGEEPRAPRPYGRVERVSGKRQWPVWVLLSVLFVAAMFAGWQLFSDNGRDAALPVAPRLDEEPPARPEAAVEAVESLGPPPGEMPPVVPDTPQAESEPPAASTQAQEPGQAREPSRPLPHDAEGRQRPRAPGGALLPPPPGAPGTPPLRNGQLPRHPPRHLPQLATPQDAGDQGQDP